MDKFHVEDAGLTDIAAEKLSSLASHMYAKARADADREIRKELMQSSVRYVPHSWGVRALPKTSSSTEYAVRVDIGNGDNLEFSVNVGDAVAYCLRDRNYVENKILREAIKETVAYVLRKNVYMLSGDDCEAV